VLLVCAQIHVIPDLPPPLSLPRGLYHLVQAMCPSRHKLDQATATKQRESSAGPTPDVASWVDSYLRAERIKAQSAVEQMSIIKQMRTQLAATNERLGAIETALQQQHRAAV
jgi:hypothetical protein